MTLPLTQNIAVDVDQLNPAQKAMIKGILYSDIFNFPITKQEVFEHCSYPLTGPEEVTAQLSPLVSGELLFSSQGYYYIEEKNYTIKQRQAASKKAKSYMRFARLVTRLIATFPFVRGILLTGSLSKGVIEKKGDVDYFIITEPGRLWLCRTMLILFKKVFLLNSRKYFCVNYFVDSDHLEIPNRNIFTATEIASAIPAYNKEGCQNFFIANPWYKKFYPNRKTMDTDQTLAKSYHLLKPITEYLFAGRIGDKLDSWCLKQTLAHWKKKNSTLDPKIFEENFTSNKYISKHHPHGFQFSIIKEYERKIKLFEERTNLSLQ